MWCAELEEWDKLIEAHPNAALWRNKPIYNYEKLKLLYGVDRATGNKAETIREMRERIRNEQAGNQATITIDEINHMVLDDEVKLEGYDTPTNINTPPLPNQDEGSSSDKRKRRKVAKDDGITSVTESFQIVANAITKAATKLVKSQEVCNISKNEIWKLLEELDFDEPEMDKAYIFLIKNPNMLWYS